MEPQTQEVVNQTPQVVAIAPANVNEVPQQTEQVNTSVEPIEHNQSSNTIATQQAQTPIEPPLTPEEKAIIAEAEKGVSELKKARKLKHPGGRPSEVTNVVVLKLVTAFQNGMDVNTACQYAGISRATFYKHMKEDEEFSDIISDAKDFIKLIAGEKLKDIIQNGSDRDAAPLVKWYLEKSIPELYGSDKIENQNNTQNNLYVIDPRQITALVQQEPTVKDSSPAELLEALETRSEVDTGTEEGSTTPVHPEEVQSQHPQESNMPQPPSTI